MSQQWKPVEDGITKLRFGDSVDISTIDTGDWRAEFLRDDQPVLTVYPSKKLRLCTLTTVPDAPSVSVPKRVNSTIREALRRLRIEVQMMDLDKGHEKREIADVDSAYDWLDTLERTKGGE